MEEQKKKLLEHCVLNVVCNELKHWNLLDGVSASII